MKINPDGTLTVKGGKLTTAQVETLIHDLAYARNQMNPRVPLDFDPRGRLLVQWDPYLTMGPGDDTSRIVLGFRHSGYGWCAFELAPANAALLQSFLAERVAGVQRLTPDDGGAAPKH